ncbi:hypothetical protein Tco_1081963 [Tanacetum coccineum]|uniref:Uncharacterized protein n=1 Tax=Tanacetum coccineum TaxID=301880 RepID=A0ABQ5HZ25_9ASTR
MSDKKITQLMAPEKPTEAIPQPKQFPHSKTHTSGSSSKQHTHQPISPITHGFLTEKEYQQLLQDEEVLRQTLEEEARAEKEAHSTDLVILTRQAQLNPDRTGQTPGIVLIVEAALIGGTLLTEIILGAETALATSKNHMIIPAPPTGLGIPKHGHTLPATETANHYREKREGEGEFPGIPAYRRAWHHRWRTLDSI